MASSFDESADGYRMEVWAVPSPVGERFAARVVVRQLPLLEVVFEDESLGREGLWATAAQATAAALDRGRQFVRLQALGRVIRASGGPAAPDEA